MKNKSKKIKEEKEVYNSVGDAVEAIFMNKKDRKRMFMALFLLVIVGTIVIATGTHFLIKQKEIIEKNKDIDWKNQYTKKAAPEDGMEGDREMEKNILALDDANLQNRQDNSEIKILFVGDLMLDRYNRELMNQKNEEWMTEKIESLFVKNDLSIANLEGPVTNEDSISVGSKEGSKNNYVFTFDPKDTGEFLKHNNINLLNLGNNHILNFGKDGMLQTKEFISENNFEYFGDINGEADEYIEKNINGTKIAFVSYNQFGGKGFAEIKKTIENFDKSNDFVFVYTHWGTEYELEENEDQIQKAHEFIDAGADLIIGSHPHVVQPVEIYKNKAIFYSLGNFIFDQYFSADTMIGLGVKVFVLGDGELDFELMPLQLQRNGQIEFADKKNKADLLERILKSEKVKNTMNF